MTSSIRIPQVFPELVGKKTHTIWKVYGEMLKYMINYAFYLARYDAYFHINDDARKCRYLSVTHNFIFSQNLFKLLSHEVLLEVCFAMDTLIKIICISIISVNFLNLSLRILLI